jgi:hypothetical protein
MPLEIRELHIKVNVNGTQENVTADHTAAQAAANNVRDKETFIAECVEEVMQIIKNRQER